MPVISPMPALDTSDRPFGLPPEITLDLPVPPSVNRTRKIDLCSLRLVNEWKQAADKFVLTQRRGQPRKIFGGYELLITLSEDHTSIDLDNGIKSLIDYLRKIEIVEDDSPKFFRRLTVEWGQALEGCRVTVRPFAVTA